jgi:hypothetical protein
MRQPPCFIDRETRRSIEALCHQNQIDVQLLSELCEIVHNYSGSGRREGITSDLVQTLDAFSARTSRHAR